MGVNDIPMSTDIYGDHFRIKRRDDGLYVSLDDTGWHWSGGQDDLLIFFIRLAKSDISDDVLGKMRQNLAYKRWKPLILSSNVESAVYAVTGDNGVWRFGYTNEVEEPILRRAASDLPEGERDNFRYFFWERYYPSHRAAKDMTDFDEFVERSTGYERVKEKILGQVRQAHSWHELFANLSSRGLQQCGREVRRDWFYTAFQPAVWEALDGPEGYKYILELKREAEEKDAMVYYVPLTGLVIYEGYGIRTLGKDLIAAKSGVNKMACHGDGGAVAPMRYSITEILSGIDLSGRRGKCIEKVLTDNIEKVYEGELSGEDLKAYMSIVS